MPGYAAPRPDATPDTSAQEFADPMGRTISPDIAARAELYRRMPNFAEQNAADVLESQRQARIAAQQNTNADNARAEAAAKATAKYRASQLGFSERRINATERNTSDLPPRVATRVDSKVRAFDANPLVKRIVTQAEAVQFIRLLDINTENPADDQGLIYAYAKAMDPESVVREGEYATVMKYAQSWAKSFEFDAKRMFSETPFLTPTARQNMRDTITKKFKAGQQQYQTLRKEYARQLNTIVGNENGGDYLTDYSSGFPTESPSSETTDALLKKYGGK